jgi:hypothetical protein
LGKTVRIENKEQGTWNKEHGIKNMEHGIMNMEEGIRQREEVSNQQPAKCIKFITIQDVRSQGQGCNI